jgi:hypothetical protein
MATVMAEMYDLGDSCPFAYNIYRWMQIDTVAAMAEKYDLGKLPACLTF